MVLVCPSFLSPELGFGYPTTGGKQQILGNAEERCHTE
jgi:hypothetical protein